MYKFVSVCDGDGRSYFDFMMEVAVLVDNGTKVLVMIGEVDE